MRIEFRRSGGFAGLSVRLALDSAELPAAERDALEALIAGARFFELADRPARPRPDAFQYDLAIEHAGRRHVVCVHDPVEPEALRPLLELLTALARGQGGRG
jgi:hypothetical protein